MMPLPDFLIFSFVTLFVNAVLVCVVGTLYYKIRKDIESFQNKWSNFSHFFPERSVPTPPDERPNFPPVPLPTDLHGPKLTPKYIDDATAARLEREQIEKNRPKGFGR